MCQDIQKVTFSCGHTTNFWWNKSRFCLFAGEGTSRFHTTYTSSEHIDDKCPRCKIGEKIRRQDKSLNRAEFRQAVEKEYAKTPDAYQEETAKKWESRDAEAHAGLTRARIAELELQIRERLVFHLEKAGLSPAGKIALLRSIVGLPDMFGRQELVLFFASRYFAADDKKRRLADWERGKLFNIANRAGVAHTFKAGLKLTEPVPLPVRSESPETCGKSGGDGGHREKESPEAWSGAIFPNW